MAFIKCKTCERYHYDDKSCGDKFMVFHEDYLGDEGKKIYALDAEEAAERYGEYYNSNGDYSLMNKEITVDVIDESGERKRFKVGAEPSIHYSTEEIEIEESFETISE